MANVTVGGPVVVINAANTFFLKDPGDAMTGSIVIMLVSSSFVGSITVQSVIAMQEAAAVPESPVPVLYRARYLNGAISTDGLVSTAITGTSLIVVPATRQTIVLACTAYTSGSIKVYSTAALGIAQ